MPAMVLRWSGEPGSHVVPGPAGQSHDSCSGLFHVIRCHDLLAAGEPRQQSRCTSHQPRINYRNASFMVGVPVALSRIIFLINLFILFIYFWLHRVFVAAHGLSLVGGERGLLFVAVHGLLVAVASLVVEHRL